MIETHYKTITIDTDEGKWEVTFNPTIPTGWDALQKALQKHMADNVFCTAMAEKNKRQAGIYWLQKQSEDAEAYIGAIKTALGEEEFGKISVVIRRVDLTALCQISTSILNSYSDWYREKLTEGFEP